MSAMNNGTADSCNAFGEVELDFANDRPTAQAAHRSRCTAIPLPAQTLLSTATRSRTN